jgi:hypothetical protein
MTLTGSPVAHEGNPQDRAGSLMTLTGSPVAHEGNPQDRAGSLMTNKLPARLNNPR